MASRLVALRVAARDPEALARFWGGLLGWSPGAGADVALVPPDDTGFEFRFDPSDEPKTVQNQMHFDLTSATADAQRETVERAVAAGARPVDVGQRPDEDHVVLADPEGNEFCVIEAGNAFLADCGFVGALACDGSAATGHFWSAALGWPLVWDQGEETAIRSPRGGPKISWGGPPLRPKAGPYRWQFELAVDGDDLAEVDRLVSLGATRVGPALLLDPDGHEFRIGSAPLG